jgi:hypothetical protein
MPDRLERAKDSTNNIIPVFVFVKYIFGGIRSQNRSGMLDEEMLATFQRQDGRQR